MFEVAQFSDDFEFCKHAIDVAGVGFAPGSAFGKGGENLVRLCHLRSHDVLERAIHQLKTLLNTHNSK
jgi:aspartate/methionine/tyrosine aminotransferase